MQTEPLVDYVLRADFDKNELEDIAAFLNKIVNLPDARSMQYRMDMEILDPSGRVVRFHVVTFRKFFEAYAEVSKLWSTFSHDRRPLKLRLTVMFKESLWVGGYLNV